MSHTVLLVDDSQTTVPELRATLQEHGYHVLTALRGEEALDMLRTSQVDLVVTEALLAGMEGFELVRRIRQNPNWMYLPIIMLTARSAPEDYVAGFDAGVNEYFVKPIEAPKLLAATHGLLMRRDQALLAPGAAPAAHGGAHLGVTRAQIITVYSLKGGVGTSTIAVNLAVAFKHLMPSARVGLMDLSLEEGLDSLMLDIVPTSTIVDWARDTAPDATPQLLYQYFVQHRTGVGLLAAPPSPETAEAVTPDLVKRTLSLARQTFDYVVVDTASNFAETTLNALEAANTIVMPVTPDMGALKTAVTSARILTAVGISDSNFRFVLNEIIPRAGLTRDQVESSLRKEVATIPHAGAAFIAAANQGMPLTSLESPPPAARAIIELARTMCEPEVNAAAAAAAPDPRTQLKMVVGRLGKLGRT